MSYCLFVTRSTSANPMLMRIITTIHTMTVRAIGTRYMLLPMLDIGESHAAWRMTGMMNRRRNLLSVKSDVSKRRKALPAMTKAAPDIAAQVTCPPGARKPRMMMLWFIASIIIEASSCLP